MKKKHLLKVLILTLFFLILIFSNFYLVQAQDTGLVPCTVNCGFNEFLTLINTVVNFFLVYLAVPIIAILFAYAGFELVVSNGDTEKKTKAKKTFLNITIGLVLVACSWVIINTILTTVGYDGCWIGFGDSCQVAKTPPPSPPSNCVSPKVLDSTTNTCVDQTPLPEPESNILVEGGTMNEEGCPLNIDTYIPEPTTFNFLDYLKTQKVLAQENKSREIKIEEAKKIQRDFQEARCWLSNWYRNRKVSNLEVQSDFDINKENILKIIEDTRYKIVDASNDQVKNAMAYAESYWNTSNNIPNPLVTIRYDEKYSDYLDVFTMIHELTHISPDLSSARYFVKNFITPKNLIESYFNRVLYYNDQDLSDIKKQISFFICYVMFGEGVSDRCYIIDDINGVLKTRIGDSNASITELSAREMEIRKRMGFSSNENITSGQAMNIVNMYHDSNYSISKWIEGFIFGAQPIFYKVQVLRHQDSFNDLIASVLIPVSGSYSCTPANDKLMCKFRKYPENSYYNKTFNSESDASEYIKSLLAEKIKDLFNNTI